jgi:hypothetical protein
VNQRERVRLLFGPYEAPPFKRGDRATCLYRDCTVVITGWSAGPIPWPRCRALDSRGRSGLLVDEELARAVRHESVLAVMHWWGACRNVVCLWRRELGVRGIDSEGTHRLVRVRGKENGYALRGKRLPLEQVEQRRRNAIKNNLAQYLVTGYHGPRWTEADIALLGTMPDEEVGRRTGRTVEGVRQKREELGISNPSDDRKARWQPEEVALLGKVPDKEAARRLGRSLRSVRLKRFKLGIAVQIERRRGGEGHERRHRASRRRPRAVRGRDRARGLGGLRRSAMGCRVRLGAGLRGVVAAGR